jgi:hypothetical protein
MTEIHLNGIKKVYMHLLLFGHSGKQSMCRSKLVKTDKSDMCPSIVCFDFRDKIQHKSTDKFGK